MADSGVIGIKITGDATGLETTLRTAGRDVDAFGGKVRNNADALAALSNGLKSAFVGSSIAVGLITLKNTVGELTQAMVQAQVQADKLRNGLNFAVGRGNAGAELEFLRSSASALGLEFVSAAAQYTKLAAAAKGTALEGQKIRDIFLSVGKASAVMGLNAEETQRIFNAFTQMISKGRVTSEELVGQVGESMPGAFAKAARAVGVTTAELTKMLETGQVLTNDFLPKFARVITDDVAPEVDAASKSMQASVNRMSTAWNEFKQTVAGSGVSSGLANEFSGLSNYITGVTDAIKNARAEGDGFIGQSLAATGNIIGRIPFDTLALAFNATNGAINTLTFGATKLRTDLSLLPEVFQTNAQKAAMFDGKLLEAEKSLAELQNRSAINPESVYFKSEIYQAQLYVQELKKARAERDLLQGRGGAGRGSVNPETVAASLEEEARRQSARKAAFTTYATDTEKLNAEIAKQKGLLGDLYTPELEARIRKHFVKPVKEGAASDDYARLAADIGRVDAAAQQYLDSGDKLQESDKFRLDTLDKIDAAMRRGHITLGQAVELEGRMFDAQQKRVAVEKQLADTKAAQAQYADQQRFQEELNRAYVEESKAREQGRKAVYEYARGIKEENDLTTLELGLMGATQEARDRAIAQYRIQLDLKKQLEEIDKNTGFDEAQREEVRERARTAALVAGATAGNRVFLDTWRKTSEELRESLTDAIMRGFENGKGFIENFRDVIVNTFKTMVLRPVVSAIVNPVALATTSLLSGGSVAAGQGGVGQVGTALPAKGLWDTVTGAFTKLGDGISTSAATIGKWMVTNTTGVLQQAGHKLYAYAGKIGTAGAYLGGAAAGYGIGTAISGKHSAFGDGKQDVATVGGTIIGAIFGGPVGAAIGGAIGGVINRAFGTGPKEINASGISGTFSGSSFSGMSYQEWSRAGGWFTSGSSGTDYSALDSTYAGNLGKAYAAITASTADLAAALGLPTSQILGYVKSIRLDASQLNEAGITSLFEGIADELARTVVSSAFIREGERAAVALARMVSSLSAVNTAFDLFNKTALSASLVAGDAASKLVDLFGGIESFNSATLEYYQTFYTEAERNAKTSAQLATAFADLGIATPDSLQAFRALVIAQDVTTESGRSMYAALMGLSSAFATVTNAAAESAKSLIKTANYVSYADYAAAMSAAGGTPVPRFAGGGFHAGGLRIVGENEPELEATGPSRLWNSNQIASALRGGGDAATAAEVKELRAENRAQARTMASILERFTSIVETWDALGMPAVQPDFAA